MTLKIGEVDACATRRVLVLYTGGTIGMKSGSRGYECEVGYLPSLVKTLPMFHDQEFDMTNVTLPHVVGEQNKITTLVMPESEYHTRVLFCIMEYAPLLDSSDMKCSDWSRVAGDIYANYDEFDGFVVLHGTDTMSFSASALSFMLDGLRKPVVFTGSQIPMSLPRNDGVSNLLGAITLAGNLNLPEVCLFFDHKLYRGNRTVKADASSLTAFTSPNLPALATLGIGVVVNQELAKSLDLEPLKLKSAFSSDLETLKLKSACSSTVAVIKLYPGLSVDSLHSMLRPQLRGVVLETFGNAPTSPAFLDILRATANTGVVIVNVTQCPRGAVEPHYASGVALREAGVVPGHDMTLEAAYAKLVWLLGDESLSPSRVRSLMQISLRGELTVDLPPPPPSLRRPKPVDLPHSPAGKLGEPPIDQMGDPFHALDHSGDPFVKLYESMGQTGKPFDALDHSCDPIDQSGDRMLQLDSPVKRLGKFGQSGRLSDSVGHLSGPVHKLGQSGRPSHSMGRMSDSMGQMSDSMGRLSDSMGWLSDSMAG